MSLFDLFGGKAVAFDGGMGTSLQKRGLPVGEMPEKMNFSSPQTVLSVHREYISSGADVLSSNTFGANRIKLAESGLDVRETIMRGVSLARQAACEAERKVLVAADLGPTGKLMRPLGELEFETAVSVFGEAVAAASEAGADFIFFETMSDLYECKAAIVAARENSSLPVAVSVTLDEDGRMLTGADIECVAVYLSGLGADAVGINCGLGPDAMEKYAIRLASLCEVPVIINANAGMPVIENGITEYKVGAERFAAFAKKVVASGVAAVGGCCGTTGEHIKAVCGAISGMQKAEAPKKLLRAVCSGTKAYFFGSKTAIIGERLNPTGKPMLKDALRRGDYGYICEEAVAQRENGADLLDVNVGLPGIVESDALVNAVLSVQSVCELPLQLDSSDSEALSRAARIYNGIPIINSVCGKKKSLEEVLPTVRKYGGLAVALLMDDNGIPASSETRLEIARDILKAACEYGINENRILFDALTMTLATDKNNGDITLACVKSLADSGFMTVLGISNISYGLPDRERVNASFLGAAVARGLTAAIINPASETAKLMIGGEGSADFDAGAAVLDEIAADNADTLFDAIFNGLVARARELAAEQLKTSAPLDIIEKSLVPALNALGDGYEKKKIFLPRLLGGAEAAKAASAVINGSLGETVGNRGMRVVIATVRGDIHDIGKNIVASLLKNYGFEVIDLGKDVPEEKILQAAREYNAPLVSLSALMTTTLPAMASAVSKIKRDFPNCRVMVGGAVLTREYADGMGADFYGESATDAVRYAMSVDKSNKA